MPERKCGRPARDGTPPNPCVMDLSRGLLASIERRSALGQGSFVGTPDSLVKRLLDFDN